MENGDLLSKSQSSIEINAAPRQDLLENSYKEKRKQKGGKRSCRSI